MLDRELTWRGLVLGALITAVFTAANVYLGLKVGLTVATSIPAAVISMAVLRALGGGTVLENNMVQTQASAAGTLSSIIFVLPGLLMAGYWHAFPFWTSAAITIAGGAMGVLFTIPLRRAMVVEGELPFPEGVAAAEILRVGDAEAATPGGPGARDIAAGGIAAAAVTFCSSGLHVLSDSISAWFTLGGAVFRLSTGFSLALLGAGYLVGLSGGLAMLLGAAISWGVAVPLLTAHTPMPAGSDIAGFATALWAQNVRLIGAGVIGIAAIWSLAGLAGPTWRGVRMALAQAGGGGGTDRTDRDLPPGIIAGLFALCLLILGVALAHFAAGAPSLAAFGAPGLAVLAVVFTAVFGFIVAAVAGYMAGLVGASSSPISGISILATIGACVLVLVLLGGTLAAPQARQAAIAFVLITVTAILAIATISNDNLQDLKTGLLVGATPWRQQVALLVGCVSGGLVIPPVLSLLHQAYGFPGALPRSGMDPAQALAAPQATLMTKIATGILGGTLAWRWIIIGGAIALGLIVVDAVLRRATARARLPVLAVGIGLYLPPTVGVTLGIGAVLGWWIERGLRGRADEERARRRGVLMASGFIVGESLVGVAMAGVIGATGSQTALAIAPESFAPVADWLTLGVFVAVCAWLAAAVRRGTS